MALKGLRYVSVGSGTALTALMLVTDKLPTEAGLGIILLLLGIAGADIKKHWVQK